MGFLIIDISFVVVGVIVIWRRRQLNDWSERHNLRFAANMLGTKEDELKRIRRVLDAGLIVLGSIFVIQGCVGLLRLAGVI